MLFLSVRFSVSVCWYSMTTKLILSSCLSCLPITLSLSLPFSPPPSTGTVMPPERNDYFRKYMQKRRNPSGEKTAARGPQSTPLADEAAEAKRIRKNERNRQNYAKAKKPGTNESSGT